ncbi:hypothetical protein GCM10011588_16970 [Nocardia jinanensis]|uniref:Uncharacterized protein n=1 Tax=Nocardia jinanensis TaxID=382504 RepID=A0A917RED5_9NOCA|nr:hypothetical protein GCM10011588_16970 [Nocardia jinanensis]
MRRRPRRGSLPEALPAVQGRPSVPGGAGNAANHSAQNTVTSATSGKKRVRPAGAADRVGEELVELGDPDRLFHGGQGARIGPPVALSWICPSWPPFLDAGMWVGFILGG